MKKMLSLLVSTALTASLIAGCSGGQPGNSAAPSQTSTPSAAAGTETPSASKDPVTLRFMWWGGDQRHQATLEVIDKFVEANPHVTIEPEYSGADGYLEKLSIQLYSGTAAELIQNGPGWIPDFMNKGDFFVDLYQYQEKIDLTGFDPEFLKNTSVYNDKLVGLPSGIAGPAFLVNTTLTQKAGIDLSKDLTWDSLIDAGKALQAYDSSKYLMNVDTPTIVTSIIRPYILQLTGNTFIVDETKQMGFTREELVQSLTYLKTLYDEKVFQPASASTAFKNNPSTNPKWIAGDFASAFCVSSTVNTFTSASPDMEFDVVVPPLMTDRKDDGFYANPPQLMCIPKTVESNSNKLDAALSFYDYFFNDDASALILKDVRSVPAVESARNLSVENNFIQPIVTKAVEFGLALNGTNEMGLTTSAEIDTIIVDMIEKVAYGTAPVEQIADESIKLIQDVLANQ